MFRSSRIMMACLVWLCTAGWCSAQGWVQVMKDEGRVAFLYPPKHVRVDFRTTHTFSVGVEGTPPLSYQWLHTRNGQTLEIPGATGAELTLENIGSDDVGTYAVRVSNGAGAVISEAAVLGAGNLRSPRFGADDLLVLHGNRLRHYNAVLQLKDEWEVPLPDDPQVTPIYGTGDVAVDRFGRLHVLVSRQNYGRPGHQGYIATFDPEFDLWFHSPLIGDKPVAPASRGDLAVSGNWLLCETARVNLIDFSCHPWPAFDGDILDECAVDLQGNILVGFRSGRVLVLDPETFEVLHRRETGVFLDALAGDQQGNLFFADQSGRVGHVHRYGDAITWVEAPPGFSGFTDISVRKDGRVAVGTRDKIWFTGRTLGAGHIIEMTGTGLTTYTTWTTRIDSPRPSPNRDFPAFPPTVAEDGFFAHRFEFEHPDPDARLTTLGPLPRWLSHGPESTVSGTPLQRDVGRFFIVIATRDQFRGTLLTLVQSEVTEVNDPPVATGRGVISGNEDEGPYTFGLTSLFTDEETPADQLVHRVVDTGGTLLLEATIESGVLTIHPRRHAFGTTVVSVEATDAGGLSVIGTIDVNIHPVPDPPFFIRPVSDLNAGPAGARQQLDLGALAADPDPGDTLTWQLTRNSKPTIFNNFELDPETGVLKVEFAPYVSGTSSITVEIADALGATAETTFLVILPDLPLPELQPGAAPVLNRQTGLYEHTVIVTNPGARAIAGFDLAVARLPADVTVHNASGGGEGSWDVHHRHPLAAGASATLILEYYVPGRGAAFEPEVSASLVTEPETDPAAGAPGLAVDRCELLQDGLLIEFTAIPGRHYEIQYSDDASGWKLSPANIRAAGNRVQWIDRGPPATDSPPGEKASRFYRVREIPIN